MNRRLSIVVSACLMLFSAIHVFGQLQTPTQPVNLIIDSDMAISADDAGDHAMMWALANRGEVKVLAEICSSANDFSAPTMWAIANYYGHPDVLIGAHKGATPILENSATSMYAQQIRDQFGKPGDTRANYPDPVPVYRQALAGAPDHSVVIVAEGFYQPLQALLQSPADSISPLTGVQLVAQKVMRLVSGAGWFPSGNEFGFRVDADAASFVFTNWPGEIVSSGVQMSQDVITGPSLTSDATKDPVKRAFDLYNSSDRTPGFGQVALLFGVRGLSTNFVASGFNGQTIVQDTLHPPAGQNSWFQTPNVGHSWLSKAGTAADLEAIINPLVQSSSNLPLIRSISPTSVAAGSSGPTVTLNGNNFFTDSQVSFNGSSRPTTFVSGTQIIVQLTNTDVAQAGTDTLAVSNPSEGPWQSSPINFTVTGSAPPPPPTLSAISPTSAVAGSGPVTLTATGSNFVASSVVQVNGASRSTTFVSATQLTATLTAGDTSTAGSLSITVNTPGGGTSAPVTFTVTNPAPSLTSISPNSATAGGPAFTLTANGSNFLNGATVRVNGSNRTTTFVSSTQLTASIPSSDIASAGTLAIGVVNPDGSATSTLSFTVNNPLPSLTSVSPSTANAGGPGFTLTVTGSNFVSTSVVQVNGSGRTTTFVNSTQLTAAIPASDIAAAGTLSITVFNPAPGGGTSAAVTFTVTNPALSLTSISPNNATAGGPAFTLTANGSNFVNGAIVQINGSNRTTTFVSGTQLTASIPASDIASAGTLTIGVVNPDGSASGTLPFTVNNPAPSLTGISPSTATAGGPGFTLTVTGSNFVSTSVVQVNGSGRTTTFVNSTQLTAAIPSSDIAAAGTLSITVFNPAPGGGTSTPLIFTVTVPPPILTSMSPSAATAGGPGFTLTANGSNFVNGSVVQVNGANRTTTFVSGTQLTAAIPAGDIASTGTRAIGVINPDGSASGTQSLAVNNPSPSLNSISPTSATAGGPGFTLTVTGSNFVSASVVQVNGAGRTTTFVSTTQLTAAIPASDIASAGTLSITVLTPAPGGGTSTALTFTVTNAPPSLASISPSTATAGGPVFTLTANGSNFVNGASVQVNGSNRTTTFVSSTQVTAAIPASDIASAGTFAIGVVNPDGSATGTLSFTVNNPSPSLSGISPTSATAGGPGFTLTITGSSFVSTSMVQVNGAGRTTTFVSSTQLTAAIPASDIASAGTLSITVFTPSPGGGTSTALTFAAISPPPSLASISPSTAIVGGPAFTLTANGSNFVNGSVVQVNGANRTTTFVSATQVTAAIPASDIASTGTRAIGVVNPDGSVSSTASLAVNNPSPSLSSISPSSATAGSAGFTLTVSGSNFVPASVVRVNGSNRTTTFVSSTQLTAAIPASDLAVAALLSITVFTPTPGGGTSAAVTFTVNNPVPSISNISPSTALVLGPSFTLTVNGSGFVSSSVVKVDGSARPTTFVSPTQLQAQISNNDILTLGQRSITVFNAAPGGGTSNAATLTVIGLLGQVTAPDPAQLAAAMDVRPEPTFSLIT